MACLDDAAEGADLDGIAERRAGPVHLHAGELACRSRCIVERAAHDVLLRRTVRRGQAGRPAILRDGDSLA